jgi:hypothetical protein
MSNKRAFIKYWIITNIFNTICKLKFVWKWKQIQLLQMFLEKYPWHLNSNMNNDQLIFTYKKNGNENENMSNVVKYN